MCCFDTMNPMTLVDITLWGGAHCEMCHQRGLAKGTQVKGMLIGHGKYKGANYDIFLLEPSQHCESCGMELTNYLNLCDDESKYPLLEEVELPIGPEG